MESTHPLPLHCGGIVAVMVPSSHIAELDPIRVYPSSQLRGTSVLCSTGSVAMTLESQEGGRTVHSETMEFEMYRYVLSNVTVGL